MVDEKRIMAETDRFCIRLIAAYKDRTHLYMVLEICQGGELFSLLQKERKLDEPASAFYGASVMLAFEYPQRNRIIYRDLKPENLLLAAEGYLKLVDFGFAKLIDAAAARGRSAARPSTSRPRSSNPRAMARASTGGRSAS